MDNQTYTVFRIFTLLSSALVLAACSSGSSSDGSSDSGPALRVPQNIIYIDSATNTKLMATNDDGSVTPFALVSVTGGTIVRNSPKKSQDGQHVAYIVTDGSTDNLFITHANGAYNEQVTSLPANRDVNTVLWSPDSSKLIYLADANVDDQYELFMATLSVNAASLSTSTEVISGSVSNTALDIASPSWSPDGSKIAYTVTDSRRTTARKTIGINYHDVSIGNRHSVRLSPTPFAAHQEIFSYTWAPDSNHLAYLSDDVTDSELRAFKITFALGTFTRMVRSLPSGFSVTRMAYSSDSGHLATITFNSTTFQFRLVTEAPDDASTFIVHDNVGNISRFSWSHNNGNILAYYSNDAAGTSILYRLDVSTGTRTELNTTRLIGDSIKSIDWSPNDDFIAYLSGPGTVVQDMYLVDPTSPDPILVQDGNAGTPAFQPVSWSHAGDRFSHTVNSGSVFVYPLASPNQSIEVVGPFALTVFSRAIWSRDDVFLIVRADGGGSCVTDFLISKTTENNVQTVSDVECRSGILY